MDATGVVLRQPLIFPSSCGGGLPESQELGFYSATNCVGPRRRVKIVGIKSSRFQDQSHVRYYNSVVASSSSAMAATGAMKQKTVKEEKAAKKLKKKQLKLLKGLFRDLTTFSHLSSGLESDGGSLLDQVKGNMISEASELLLKQLEKLKAEEKQLKRRMKEEKARLKAEARKILSGSSSSESSSSDNECGEIMDMNNLKKQVIQEATTLTYLVPTIPSITAAELNGLEELRPSCNIAENETTGKSCAEPNCLEEVRPSSYNTAEHEMTGKSCLKKIEVCMGGKCKKSGASALLEEFQRAIGVDGAVSGCKCMGKCRDGPNVKVSDGALADKSVRASGSNSLCIGVTLEDVDMIVGSFLGGKDNQIGFVPAC